MKTQIHYKLKIKQAIASIAFLLLVAPVAYSAPLHQPKVIVIGAGIAGLAAAKTLDDQHVSAQILEARNRIGGRIYTVYPWGPGLDLGATWIHGMTNNPIKEMASRQHIPALPTAYNDNEMLDKLDSFKLYHQGSDQITKKQLDRLRKLAKKFDDFLIVNRDNLSQSSLAQALNQFINEQKIENSKSALLRYLITNNHLYEFGADLSALSAVADDVYTASDVSDKNALFPYGFSQILPALAENIPITLNQQVKKIIYNDAGVDVYTQSQHYHADYVIITLPLGVLQSGDVAFEPRLPEFKLKAINSLGMATYEKIYLFFNQLFWDKQPEWIGYLPEDGRMNESPDIMNYYKFTRSYTLLAFTAGSFGKTVSHWEDKKTVDYVMKILKSIYGDSIPQPSSYVITRWSIDPFSYGSYSYLPAGTNKDNYKKLGQPVMRRLFFAGEATSETDPGTVHGAYLSGIRAAKEVIVQWDQDLKMDTTKYCLF